jgi:hypothetical protein
MGYDPRATKVSKTVKRMAATILDPHKRRSIIKSYAEAERAIAQHKGSRNRSKGD